MLVAASSVYTIWPETWDFALKEGIYGPQIITCPIPRQFAQRIPEAVSLSLVENCTQQAPSNVLRVIYNQRNTNHTKPSIGICVQALRFGALDFSVRLVEWLEMIKIMRADKVYFYVMDSTESMFQVLRHYAKEVVGFQKKQILT